MVEVHGVQIPHLGLDRDDRDVPPGEPRHRRSHEMPTGAPAPAAVPNADQRDLAAPVLGQLASDEPGIWIDEDRVGRVTVHGVGEPRRM